MGRNSTPFLSYQQIKTDTIDLYEDAWGLYHEFEDVIVLLNEVKTVPKKRLTKRLIRRIRQLK